MTDKLEFPLQLIDALEDMAGDDSGLAPDICLAAQQAANLIRSQHDMIEAVTALAEKAIGGTLPSYTRAIDELKNLSNLRVTRPAGLSVSDLADVVSNRAQEALAGVPGVHADAPIGVGDIDAKLLEDLRSVILVDGRYMPIDLSRAIADHVDAKIMAFGDRILDKLGVLP